jgi:hypothetical protein
LELKVESRCTVGLFGNNKEENGKKRSLNNVHMYKQKANFDDIQHETSMECAYKFQIRLALLEILDSDFEWNFKVMDYDDGERKKFASTSSVCGFSEKFTRGSHGTCQLKSSLCERRVLKN